MEPMGPIERRLLEVERGLMGMAESLRQIRRDQIAIAQGIWDLDSELGRHHGTTPTPTPTPTPNTTVAGFASGCNGSTAIASTITITVTSGGALLWTGSQGTSGFGYTSASFYIAGSTGVTVDSTPTSARLVPNSITSTIAPGTNPGRSITHVAATGYACTTLFPLPLATTLHVTDATLGTTTTLTYSGGTWSGTNGAVSYAFTSGGVFRATDAGGTYTATRQSAVGPPSTVNVVYTLPGGGGTTWPPTASFTINE